MLAVALYELQKGSYVSYVSVLFPSNSLVIADKPSGLQVQVSAKTCLFKCRVQSKRSEPEVPSPPLPFVPKVIWEREIGYGNTTTYLRLASPYWYLNIHIFYNKFGRVSCSVSGNKANCDYSTECDIANAAGKYRCSVTLYNTVVQSMILPGR